MSKRTPILFIIILVGVAIFLFRPQEREITLPLNGTATDKNKEAIFPEAPFVRIRGTDIAVEIATTSAAVTRGLGGRDALGEDSGMLFIFEKPAIYSFWMKDMRFPIDMLWIENEKIIDIDKNIPADWNALAPKLYAPRAPVRYVLEVNAGFVDEKSIHVGDAVFIATP